MIPLLRTSDEIDLANWHELLEHPVDHEPFKTLTSKNDGLYDTFYCLAGHSMTTYCIACGITKLNQNT